jgi:hypothetical protein
VRDQEQRRPRPADAALARRLPARPGPAGVPFFFSIGYSPWRYWLAVALGKSVVYVVLALGGQTVIPLIF